MCVALEALLRSPVLMQLRTSLLGGKSNAGAGMAAGPQLSSTTRNDNTGLEHQSLYTDT